MQILLEESLKNKEALSVISLFFRPLEEPMTNEDGERPADPFASAKMHDAWKRRIQEAFVSIQIEKVCFSTTSYPPSTQH